MTGKERGKLIITGWKNQIKNKPAFTESHQAVILNIPDEQMDIECWNSLELFKWTNFIWRKDIERIWQVLLLAIQNAAILRDAGDAFKDHPFVMYDLEVMKTIIASNYMEFREYEAAVKEVEKILDTAPFDDDMMARYQQWLDLVGEVVKHWNLAVDELKLDPTTKIEKVPVAEARVKEKVEEAQWLAKMTAKTIHKLHEPKGR